MSKVKQTLGSIGRIVLLCAISLILGTAVYSWNAQTLTGNAMPMPFGFGISVVLSGSMEPALSVDDLVLIRAADSYEVKDIVVYQDGSSLIIHRILSIDGDEIVTMGDANDAADPPIRVSTIKGKAVAHIPYVGAVIRFFKSTAGMLLLVAAAALLFELPYWQKRKKAAQDREQIREEIRRLKGDRP